MSSLPPEIITSILIRLPVKTLLRVRCVSKPWCSQIDGPDFINLHLSHSMSTPSKLYPIDDYTDTLYSLDSNSLEKPEKIETPFINLHTPILLSTCNGLLLSRHNNDGSRKKIHKLFLFNPATRNHLFLPTPPPESKYADVDYVHQTNCLGYDVTNDDYKVFNFLEFLDKTHQFIACEARVYSLKSNLWRIVKNIAKEMISHCMFGSYFNGSLHTVNDEDHRYIVALDVGKETFSFMHLPNFRDKNVSLFRTHIFDGCLAVLCRYEDNDNRTDIWLMKEYGVKESWGLFLSVKPDYPLPLVIPMVYSKSRNEVLLSYACQKLVWYDLRKNTVRGFQISGLPNRMHPIACVESLASVDGTAKIVEKKRRHREEKMKLQIVKKKRDDFFQKDSN